MADELAISTDIVADGALRGLDFIVRHQVRDTRSADHGRFAFIYDCETDRTVRLTTNWTTGVCVEALLVGLRFTKSQTYLESARRGISYIKSLQEFSPSVARGAGVIREMTPQSPWCHPRDALTAAWAMLDWADHTGDEDALQRAKAFARWFMDVAMEKGYPYWTIRLDGDPWTEWSGSFHSGGAFFFYRLFEKTHRDEYRRAMRTILQHYNAHHLDESGAITVIRGRSALESLDGRDDLPGVKPGWKLMHRYNDDFGALANLAAWSVEQDLSYRDAAVRFLERMVSSQREDGGFGAGDHSVPSAAGPVLIELLAARKLGVYDPPRDVLDRAVRYLLDRQVRREDAPADGAILGCDSEYTLSDRLFNARTAAYGLMAMLRYLLANDPFYFFEK